MSILFELDVDPGGSLQSLSRPGPYPSTYHGTRPAGGPGLPTMSRLKRPPCQVPAGGCAALGSFAYARGSRPRKAVADRRWSYKEHTLMFVDRMPGPLRNLQRARALSMEPTLFGYHFFLKIRGPLPTMIGFSLRPFEGPSC